MIPNVIEFPKRDGKKRIAVKWGEKRVMRIVTYEDVSSGSSPAGSFCSRERSKR